MSFARGAAVILGLLLSFPLLSAADDTDTAMAEIAKAYQANYLAQKALPNTTSPAQRARLRLKTFSSANAAIGKLLDDRFDTLQSTFKGLEKRLTAENADGEKQLRALGIDPPEGPSSANRRPPSSPSASTRSPRRSLPASSKVPNRAAATAGTKLASAPLSSHVKASKAKESKGTIAKRAGPAKPVARRARRPFFSKEREAIRLSSSRTVPRRSPPIRSMSVAPKPSITASDVLE